MNALCVSRAAGALAVFAALLPVVAVPTAGAATVPIPSPATVLSVSPTNTNGDVRLQGAVCQSPNICTTVRYLPFITPSGVTALQNALTTTLTTQPPPTKIIVFGYSHGAMVAEQWLKQHLNDPNAPSPQVLSFVVIGNPTRAFGGVGALNGEVWPQSGYDVIDIARQYDGPADYPNNRASPYYLMAALNATIGGWRVHDYRNVNINDPANAVWTVDNITYVLTPTQNVPILGWLAPLFPSLNAQLKAQIETAYIRPVPFPTTTQPASPETSSAVASALSTSVVSDPTVALRGTTVPVSVVPAPTTATTGAVPPAPAPPATGPTETNSLDTVPTAAAATPTPTLPGTGDVARTVKKITVPAAKPRLDTTTATKHTRATSSTNGTPSTTATKHTRATSSTNGTPSTTATKHTPAASSTNANTGATDNANGKKAAKDKANGGSGGHP